MDLDIHTAVQTALVISLIAMLLSIVFGIRSIRKARGLPFFRMRRITMTRGWSLLGWAVFFGLLTALLNTRIEPLIYNFFPPTPTRAPTSTITLIPSNTVSPTITLSPTITNTPLVSNTPTITSTPDLPLAVELRFESTITPNPGAIFSDFTFTDGLDEQYRPLKPGEVFQNPISHMYAVFSYDQMVVGSQWTALWYRGPELVNYETIPWNGGSGGLGYTDWAPDPSEWLAGEYEVQIFVGTFFRKSGRFIVEGEPPTPLPSATPTSTLTPTPTDTPTRTPFPTQTRPSTNTARPSATAFISQTPTIKPSPYPTQTRLPSPTPRPSPTAFQSMTPTVKPSPYPTQTRTPTQTPRPTVTPRISATSTIKPTAYPTQTRTNTPTATLSRTPTLTKTPN
jgi:hypothetical protein